MQKPQILKKSALLVLALTSGIFFSSCTEKISGVGGTYLHDTVTSGIHTFSDSTILNFSPVVKRTVIASGRSFNLNTAASALFFGKVDAEKLEVWAAMKMPILPDSIGQILTDTLILRSRFAYQYGSASDQNIDFSVWTEPNNVINDSTYTIAKTDLKQIVGTFKGTVANASLDTITIGLDTSILNPLLRTASLSLVIVPNASMNTIRNFASIDNGDNTFSPQLKMKIKGATDTTKITRYPINDFHIVISDDVAPAGEFILRGSYATRERVVIDVKSIRDQLGLNPFATINSALLQVRSDIALHTTSNQPVDTTGPSLAYIPNTSVADSGHSFVTTGSLSASDNSLYSFQIRGYIEHALRLGDDSLVLELRGGYIDRAISGSAVDVEDYTINKWVLFGTDAADTTKRPKLVLTYSFLR